MKELKLKTFFVEKYQMDLLQFFDLDSDYNGDNGDEYWELGVDKDEDGDLKPLAIMQGYETEAERLLSLWDNEDDDDHSRISYILEMISDFCHGSFSTNFTFNIVDTTDGYAVSVAYIY